MARIEKKRATFWKGLNAPGSHAHFSKMPFDAEGIIELVDLLLHQALSLRASDVHFVNEESEPRVLYRVDGVLMQAHQLEKQLWPQICNRLKVMANMDIAQKRKPQDGSFHMDYEGLRVDCRLSCHPIRSGESLVLRFLPQEREGLTLENLGFSEEKILLLTQIAEAPEGLVLVVGPTGSGKTTTLYSLLSYLNHPGVNIMTLEDPIEYSLDHIRQTQVSETLTFAQGIRSLLRQDPDIILVGEIRDPETALMAMQASLTGHKIFTTLHTSDVFQALHRLEDLGVSREKFSHIASAIISQRLLRQLCNVCKIPTSSDSKTFEPIGCSQCSFTGYHGRFPIAQILLMTPDMRKSMGMGDITANTQTLWEEGMKRVNEGRTSLKELKRVIPESMSN